MYVLMYELMYIHYNTFWKYVSFHFSKTSDDKYCAVGGKPCIGTNPRSLDAMARKELVYLTFYYRGPNIDLYNFLRERRVQIPVWLKTLIKKYGIKT